MMEAHCNCFNAMLFPCRLLNGECEFTTAAVPDAPTQALIALLPETMPDFLGTDLDATLNGLAPELLALLHEYQNTELRKIQKEALKDAWAEHILDNGIEDVPSAIWADKKAAALSTCLDVSGLVAEAEAFKMVSK